MKESLSIKILITLFLTLFVGLDMKAEPPPIPTVGPIKTSGSGNDLPIYYPSGENCSASPIPLGIILANLQPIGINEYGLPEGYDTMYLEYSIEDGPIDRVPLVQAEFLEVSNNIPLYIFTVSSYPVDLTSLCKERASAENTLDLNYTMRLVKRSFDANSEYEDYDACNYTDECDIFSCLVFQFAGPCTMENNPPNCLVNPSEPYDPSGDVWTLTCKEQTLISSTGDFIVSCSTCRDDAPWQGTGNQRSISSDDLKISNFSLSAQPNPFIDEVTVNWSVNKIIEQISLYDINGKLIRDWDKTTLKSELRIDTNNLPQGVYFLKANSVSTTKVLKLVKQ